MKKFLFSLAMVFAMCCIPGQAAAANSAVQSSWSTQTSTSIPAFTPGIKCEDVVIIIIQNGNDNGWIYC
ncbi:MAG: hypothetical protein LKH27_11005 [Prevotella sp.]|jgi:hypothetical protein|nr:hypothetical protein [Prevotella sp.]MCH3993189.1 hypothetical protein [Prevotella sp.]MCI1474921.1 hypothetical protein [Prevotella sp.]MCI1550103.1 hypothetical protein [Prevotella sp.]MCI1597060.1 hypothetical protein [Prevotella sp.]